MFDPDLLLTPLEGDSPCGPDLEYDPIFLQMEAAARGREEQRMGHSVIAAVKPDWQSVRSLSLALFSRTKDLRVAMYLLRAELWLNGIAGLSCGLKLLAGLLQRYEDTVHPFSDGDNDSTSYSMEYLFCPYPQEHTILGDLHAIRIGEPDGLNVFSIASANIGWQQALISQEQTTPGLIQYLVEAKGALWAINQWQMNSWFFWYWHHARETELKVLVQMIDLLLNATKSALDHLSGPANSAENLDGNFAKEPPIPSLKDKSFQVKDAAELPSGSYSQMVIESMLMPVCGSEPCGSDPEYSPEFIDLEHTAKSKPDQQIGRIYIPATEPDWWSVFNQSLALFSKSKDLRIAIYLLRSATKLKGLEGAANGLHLIRELVSHYWEHFHPTLDPEDKYDPTYRINIFRSLSHPETFLGDLYSLGFGYDHITVPGYLAKPTQNNLLSGISFWHSPEATIRRCPIADVLQNPAMLEHALAIHQAVFSIENLLNERVGDLATVLRPLQDFTKNMLCTVQCVSALSHFADNAVNDGFYSHIADLTQDIVTPEDPRSSAWDELEHVYAWLDQATFDVPRECRRANRLAMNRFIDIARTLLPERTHRVEHFFEK